MKRLNVRLEGPMISAVGFAREGRGFGDVSDGCVGLTIERMVGIGLIIM